MILAIDVGNTNIVLGCIDKGKIHNIVRIKTDADATAAEYAIKLKDLIALFGLNASDFDGAILSSVVPPVNAALVNAVKMVTGLDCITVGPGIKTGMNVKIDDPSTLGCDLAVGGVAAINYYGTPAIVIDMGTATTITLVDKTNSFRGGAIIPGVKLSYASLSSNTSLLPDISITPPAKCIASNTADCMRSGAVYGTAAMIDGMIDRMEAELGEKCHLIATGGLAAPVTKYCSHDIICDDDLLLKGLWVLYEKNKKEIDKKAK